MNLHLLVMLAVVLIIVELSPYRYSRLYLAAAALLLVPFQCLFPTTPFLCMLLLWMVLAAGLGFLWIKQGACLLALFARMRPQLVVVPELVVLSGQDLIGELAEISAVYRDGFVSVKLHDASKSTQEWKGRDSKSFDKNYRALKIGQKVKVIDFKDQHLIIEATD